jgi:hypothetical protein
LRLMKDQNRKSLGLLTASLAFGLIMPDENVVAVALPTIRRDLLMSRVFSLGSGLLSIGDCRGCRSGWQA